jgi:hypothetical protein
MVSTARARDEVKKLETRAGGVEELTAVMSSIHLPQYLEELVQYPCRGAPDDAIVEFIGKDPDDLIPVNQVLIFPVGVV